MGETQAPIEEIEARVRFFIAAPAGRAILREDDLKRILDDRDRLETRVIGLLRSLAMKWLGFALWIAGAFLWGRISA